jgi:uncharacterized protein YukJ
MKDWKEDLAKVVINPINEEEIQNHIIELGNVYYIPLKESDGLYDTQGYESRNKYCIIVGFTEDGKALGVVLVNSKLYSHIDKNFQYPLKKENYNQLEKQDISYVDCTDIMNPIDDDRCNFDCFKFKLSDVDLNNIVEKIKSKDNKRMKIYKKKLFGLNQ